MRFSQFGIIVIPQIKSVDEFVNEVNHSLKNKQENERLKGITARIESYDIVDSKDDDLDKVLKTHKFDFEKILTSPMLNCHPDRKRHLLLEGDLKFKDSSTSKVSIFLLIHHPFIQSFIHLIIHPSI